MVTAYLIPIKVPSTPDLAAVHFAMEFGKRNGGVFYCLFVTGLDSPAAGAVPPDAAGPSHPGGVQESDPIRQTIETQIAQARMNAGLQIQSVCRQGDFIQEVRQFVRDHHIAEIILGIPEDAPDCRARPHPDALLLHQLTHCRILTVKPKAKEQDPSCSPSS
jgi:hypothetical protein